MRMNSFSVAVLLLVLAAFDGAWAGSSVETSCSFQVRHLGANIHFLRFRTGREMNQTFMRFSDHQEGRVWKSRIFSIREYKDWYRRAISPTGRFTYYSEWGGHNLKAETFAAFLSGKFKRLTALEREVLSFVETLDPKFYLIASAEDGAENFLHEVAHGLFYVDAPYRRATLRVLESMDLRPIYRWLHRADYHPDSFRDEAQAYLLEAYEDPYYREMFGDRNFIEAAEKVREHFIRRLKARGLTVSRIDLP